MVSITIRNLDGEIKRKLKPQAVDHDRSMEAETRNIFRQAVSRTSTSANLGQTIHQRFAALSSVNLDLPLRETMPDAPRFD